MKFWKKQTDYIIFGLILILLTACSTITKKPDMLSVQSMNNFRKKITKKINVNYLLFLPEGYQDGGKDFPLIMFLHGAGERGKDLNKVKIHGPAKIVEKKKDFPFIVLSPQCPEGVWWDTEVLLNLLDDVVSRYRIDKSRIYLTGLSMGGFASWKLAAGYPSRFAAIAPVCGGGAPFTTRALKDIPTWVFHGAKDPVVPLRESEIMVEALKRFGGNVKLTVYPEAGHDSWTETYDNPELYDWFLKQKKRQPLYRR